MKKNVMFLVLMMMSTIIFAQRHQGEQKGSGNSERLKKELSLSDDQFSKVKSIKTKYAQRRAAIRKDSTLTQGTARKQLKNLTADQETELKGVLTADQWTKYSAMKAKKGEERKKHLRGKTEKG
jgi:hypothetical protein